MNEVVNTEEFVSIILGSDFAETDTTGVKRPGVWHRWMSSVIVDMSDDFESSGKHFIIIFLKKVKNRCSISLDSIRYKYVNGHIIFPIGYKVK